MGPKLTMFLMFVFFWGTLLSLMIEGEWYGASEIDIVDSLTGYNIAGLQDTGFMAIPKLGWGFFTHGLPKLLLWDYAFLTGSLSLIRWFMVCIFSTGIVWAVASTFIGAIQGLFRR